MLLKHLFTNR